jgi:hydrogenase nickel incorporation protein HypA/HybF
MHEMSLVRSLMAQVEQLVTSNGGGTLRRARVQIGPLSGVEPALMASAWEQLCAAGGLAGATLEIEEVPLVARCRNCDLPFQPVRFRFRCPACGRAETEIVSGDGIILHSIALEDAQQGATA